MSKEKIDIELRSFNINDVKDFEELRKTLKAVIVKNKWFTTVKGNKYVYVEGWQFLGGLLGISAIPTDTQCLTTEAEKKYVSTVHLVDNKTGRTTGGGVAMCTDQEKKNGRKVRTDEYAILSMAQTRAVGKAFRLNFGWIMKTVGFEGTPAEEMDEKQREEQGKEEKFAAYIKSIEEGVYKKENLQKQLEKIADRDDLSEEQKDIIKNILTEKIKEHE
jgi:hypothetical protein